MSTHPAIDMDVKEAAERGLFTAPALVARKRGSELERFNAWVSGLADRSGLDLRASIETCSDPARLWEVHMELMRRGVPPILRGPRPWHLGMQGRFLEFAADLAWLSATDPGHHGRYALARSILKTRRGSREWWPLVLRQFGHAGNVRALVLALGLSEPQRMHLRTLQTSTRGLLFEKLHGDSFGRLIERLETDLRDQPDRSGRTDPRVTAIRRAQLWRVHRLLNARPADTARAWAALGGEALTRQQVAKQLNAAAAAGLAFERAPFALP